MDVLIFVGFLAFACLASFLAVRAQVRKPKPDPKRSAPTGAGAQLLGQTDPGIGRRGGGSGSSSSGDPGGGCGLGLD
jgi:hypothetical protein